MWRSDPFNTQPEKQVPNLQDLCNEKKIKLKTKPTDIITSTGNITGDHGVSNFQDFWHNIMFHKRSGAL